MMDEYLVPSRTVSLIAGGRVLVSQYFARVEIAAPLNAALRPEHRLNDTSCCSDA